MSFPDPVRRRSRSRRRGSIPAVFDRAPRRRRTHRRGWGRQDRRGFLRTRVRGLKVGASLAFPKGGDALRRDGAPDAGAGGEPTDQTEVTPSVRFSRPGCRPACGAGDRGPRPGQGAADRPRAGARRAARRRRQRRVDVEDATTRVDRSESCATPDAQIGERPALGTQRRTAAPTSAWAREGMPRATRCSATSVAEQHRSDAARRIAATSKRAGGPRRRGAEPSPGSCPRRRKSGSLSSWRSRLRRAAAP